MKHEKKRQKHSYKRKPDTIQLQMERAIQQHQAGRLQDAVILYEQVLAIKPDHADALHLSGVAAHQTGQNEAAVQLIQNAINISPLIPVYYYNLGAVCHALNNCEAAIQHYLKALSLNPCYAEVYSNMGNSFKKLGKIEKAISCYQEAIRLKPDFADAYNNLGTVYNYLQQYHEAQVCFQKTLMLKPACIDAMHNMGNSYKDQGQLFEAVLWYQKALTFQPGHPDICNNLGNVLQTQGKVREAISCFEIALKHKPDLADAYNNLGMAYDYLHHYHEAQVCFQKAMTIQPGHPVIHNNLGKMLLSQGKVREAISCFEIALKQQPEYAGAHSNLLLVLNYLQDEDQMSLFQKHLAWDIQHGSGVIHSPDVWQSLQSPYQKIHIGYLSPDFRQHSVAYFIEPVLKAHDPSRFKVTCYSDTIDSDEVTQRIKGMGWEWRDVFGLSDDKLFDLIQTDGVHILIDLAGHTANNRMKVFALKPAPVQVSYIGYPNTTGLKAMDYRITDGVADPPGVTDRWYTEKLIRLSNSFLCYQPPNNTPDVSDLPARHSNRITFASFNNCAKITEAVIRTWATILKLTPGARLILKSRAMADTETCRTIVKQFEDCHVNPKQLELIGFLPFQSHLTLYQQVDIALDTFPYNGTTTTCEALWMGVPVIVLEGRSHVSRVGVSLLTSVGLDAFIAGSVDEYIQKAITVCQDFATLSTIRSSMRQLMKNSPLMDAKTQTQSIEQAYEAIWLICMNQYLKKIDIP